MGRLLIVAIVALFVSGAAQAQRSFDVDILAETFGFDESTRKSVALDKFMQGCPARDCIPSIDNPKYLAAGAADHVADDDLVITLAYKGEYFAFPTSVLDHHEIVNGTFAGVPLAITWCPLCGSAVGIERTVGDTVTTFGVSGVLYNSDLVLYDRATETLWDQIEAKGVVGPMTDEQLVLVPVSMSRWLRWYAKHPNTLVLSTDTGFDKDYSQDRFAEYRESVLAKDAVYAGEITGKDAVVNLHEDGSVTMQRDGETLHPIRLFWFAWYTFHPETDLVL